MQTKINAFGAALAAARALPEAERNAAIIAATKAAFLDIAIDPKGTRVLLGILVIASAAGSGWLNYFSMEPAFPFTLKWLYALLVTGWTLAELGIGLGQKKLADYFKHLSITLVVSFMATLVAVYLLKLPDYLLMLWVAALVSVAMAISSRKEWELAKSPTSEAADEGEGIITAPPLPSGEPEYEIELEDAEAGSNPEQQTPKFELNIPDWVRGAVMAGTFLLVLKAIGGFLALGR